MLRCHGNSLTSQSSSDVLPGHLLLSMPLWIEVLTKQDEHPKLLPSSFLAPCPTLGTGFLLGTDSLLGTYSTLKDLAPSMGG